MRVSRLLTGLAGLAIAGSAPASAQGKPDFSGTWVMDASKSDFGPIPSASARTDVVIHRGNTITVKRTMTTDGTVTNADLTYGIDGKPYTNKVADNDATSVLRWEGQVLVIESTVKTPTNDATIIDRYTLSADKKTMTQKRRLSAAGQQFDQTIVLTRK